MRMIMIGDIYGNNTPLYYPDDKEYTAYGTDWNRKAGLCGEFTFNIPKSNPRYQDIEEFKVITLLRDGKEEWRGFISSFQENSDKESMNIYCLEDLAWLKVSVAPVQQNVDRATKLQSFISSYNALPGVAGTVKTFEAGYVISGGTGLWQVNYDTNGLDALRGLAGENQYVRVRRQYDNNNVLHRYIDFVTLGSYGINSRQKIEFGENLRDFVKEYSTSWMLNVINPYGAEIEGDEVYEGCTRRIAGTPLSDSTSIAHYGRIEKNIIFETSDLTSLNSQAADYLNRNKDPRLTLELNAVDLSQAGYDTDCLDLGDKVRVIAEPYNIDQYVYITELNIDVQDLAKNIITLSSEVPGPRTLTEQQAEITKEISKLPTKQSILDAAKANSIAILDGTNGGNIYFVFNEAGQIIEQGFANNPDLTLATVINRWNINGKAILTREQASDPWTVKTAETIDGGIVADFIKTGTMSADRVRTGKFESFNYEYRTGNYNYSGTIVDMDNGLIRTPGFKADGDGNVFIKSGATIGGYAKTSDIPDVSGYATKAGLAQQDYTIINGGNIKTGNISANRIYGDTLMLGGSNNAYGKLIITGVPTVFWEYDHASGGMDFRATWPSPPYDQTVSWCDVNVSSLGPNDQVGIYTLGDNVDVPLYNGRTIFGINVSLKYIIFSGYNEGYLKISYANAVVQGNKDGIIAEKGNIGTIKLEDGELYKKGTYLIKSATKKCTSSSRHLDFSKVFKPYRLYFSPHDSSFIVSVKFKMSASLTGAVYLALQKYYSGSWNLVDNKIQNNPVANTEYTLTFTTAIPSDDTYRWRVNIYVDSGAIYEFDYEINALNVRIVSISDLGNYGTFKGSHLGSANFDTLDTDDIDVYDSSTGDYISSYGVDITHYKQSNNTLYSVQWQSSSDRRLKEDIEALDVELSKNLIDAILPKKFRFKNNQDKHYGMIAQEVRELLDNLGESDAHLEYSQGDLNVEDQRAIEYEEFIPHIINYIKFLRAETEGLKDRLKTLEGGNHG